MELKCRFSPDAEKLVDRARDIFPVLRRNAASNDANRFICDESIEVIRSAGLWGILVPERWGGPGGSLATFTGAIMEVSKACPSTGWVFEILSNGAWMPSTQSDRVQEEVYRDGPVLLGGSTHIAGHRQPALSVERVDGGIVVSGCWDYVSGCLHAQWLNFAVPLREEGAAQDSLVVCLTPVNNVTVEDTWHVAGMRGTASRTIVARDLFVPEHMILAGLGSTETSAKYPRVRHVGAASDFLGFHAEYVTTTAAVLVGIAEGVLEMTVENAPKRAVWYTPYTSQTQSQVIHRDIGEAAVQIEIARQLVERNSAEQDHYANRGEVLPANIRARIRGRGTYIPKILRQAVDTLMSIGGASGFANASGLQRHWRDLNMASRHVVVNSNPGLEFYGRALLGVKPDLTSLY